MTEEKWPALANPDVISVTWLDACSPVETWAATDDFDETPVKSISVGYLLKWDSEKLVLAGSINRSSHVGDVNVIPAGMVHDVTVIVTGKRLRKPRE